MYLSIMCPDLVFYRETTSTYHFPSLIHVYTVGGFLTYFTADMVMCGTWKTYISSILLGVGVIISNHWVHFSHTYVPYVLYISNYTCLWCCNGKETH